MTGSLRDESGTIALKKHTHAETIFEWSVVYRSQQKLLENMVSDNFLNAADVRMLSNVAWLARYDPVETAKQIGDTSTSTIWSNKTLRALKPRCTIAREPIFSLRPLIGYLAYDDRRDGLEAARSPGMLLIRWTRLLVR